MAINLFEYEKELVNFLRNQDIISVSDRGVTTTTETFSGNASDVDFDLANTNVKNVRLIQITAVTQSYGTDYSIDFDGSNPGRITFTSPPASGTNNISIQYDYGSTDRIYPDFPRADLKLSSYPRVAVNIISVTSSPMGLGGDSDNSALLVSTVVFDAGMKSVLEKVTTIRNSIRSNKDAFYNFDYITPNAIDALIKSTDRNDEIVQQNADFNILNVVEVN